LDRDDVIQLIAEEEERLSKAVNITQEMVLKELAILAFADLSKITTWDGQNFVLKPFSELTRDQIALISSVKVMPRQFGGIDLEFKTPSAADKKAALVDLGKHLGMFWEGEKQGDPTESAKKIMQSLREQEERTAPKE
jgi:phage terminase small subunit